MIGIDEVGRGAWAGPLVVAGVRLPADFQVVSELADSKVLNPHKRAILAKSIREYCEFHIVFKSAHEVDKLGLTAAIREAAIEITEVLSESEYIQLDGPYNFLKQTTYEAIAKNSIRADSLYPEVMAASIIAKVARDTYMQELHTVYPLYGFDTNVGYGTRSHLKALQSHGICDEHRTSYKPVRNCMMKHGEIS